MKLPPRYLKSLSKDEVKKQKMNQKHIGILMKKRVFENFKQLTDFTGYSSFFAKRTNLENS